jgi:uncharacterized protein YdiU (UPF0061 family)
MIPVDKLRFDNSYARLPERFFARLPPTPVAAPQLLQLNVALAAELGLDPEFLATPQGLGILAGNRVPEGAEPLAMAYAGHQFGNFVPALGDGRAILLGELIDTRGERRDLQLKGAGRTPFSRMGDGRAVVGPVLREYLLGEAMAALGIRTTRGLAAVATGEPILREGWKPGAVLTRVARSHVRIGTFQFFARRGDLDALQRLVDYVCERHYPETTRGLAPPERAAALLGAVIDATAALIASWQLVGFIHGVMNTDNMSIAAETIDYGPCAFMDRFDPAAVYSSIDAQGRYAYGNQPAIAHWNLTRFAETLLPLLAGTESEQRSRAESALEHFAPRFTAAWEAGLRRKLGLELAEPGDLELARELLECMAAGGADFTLTFRGLGTSSARALFAEPAAFDAWERRWQRRLERERRDPAARAAAMRAVNPAYIPRNHRVEAALAAAEQRGDLEPFRELLAVLAAPFDERLAAAAYAAPPRPEEVVQATFCGT